MNEQLWSISSGTKKQGPFVPFWPMRMRIKPFFLCLLFLFL